MIAVLDVQHGVQGAGIARGSRVGEYVERDLVAQYAAVARFGLLEAGVHVWCLPFRPSTYRQRHAWVSELARANPGQPVAYVACHAESMPWVSGHVYYDARSKGGAELAVHCTEALNRVEEVAPAKVVPAVQTIQQAEERGLRPIPGSTPDHHWTSRAWACIAGIYSGPSNVSGVTFEPFSLRIHLPQLLMRDVGQALARGVLAWLQSEKSRFEDGH